MEELRSTDFLDHEIEEDAKRQAEEYIANAREQCDQILSQIPKRLEEVKLEKEKFYSEKEKKFKTDLDSSTALEKSRFLVSYINSSVIKQIDSYFNSLALDKVLEHLIKMLDDKESLVANKEFDLDYYGFDEKMIRQKLEGKFGIKINSCKKVDFVNSGEEKIEGLDLHLGIIARDSNRTIKIRLTLEQLVRKIMDKNNRELAAALFCGRIPE